MSIEARLTEGWFYLNYLNFFSKEKIPKLFDIFVSKWSNYNHLDEKKKLNCSKLINIDGNLKCNRLKCIYSGIEI